ncbi:MAG: radical SAM protein [Candidatus Omnitrophota bacterium]
MAIKTDINQEFYAKLHKQAREKLFPLRVMFELTYECNFKCRHCYVPQSYKNKKKELKTKEICIILDQLKDLGCFYLGFTGGEPFMRKDIIKILSYAKKSGFEIIIYTNGSLINAKIAAQLGSLRPNKVDITIPGMSKKAFELISGANGSRDKVFKAIELLRKNEVSLGFKTCVLKENEKEIKKIQDFAASLGALHRLDDMLLPRLDGSREPFEYRGVLTKDEGGTEKGELSISNYQLAVSNEEGSKREGRERGEACSLQPAACSVNSLFKCGVGQAQAAITPFGELKMCLMIDYLKYNILKMGLRSAWDKMKKAVKDIKPDDNYQCSECELEDYCKWCPAKAWLNNKDFTSCDSESKRKAESLSLKV